MAKGRARQSQSEADKYVQFVKTVHLTSLGMDSANVQIDRDAFAAASSGGNLPVHISGRQDIEKIQASSFSVRGNYSISVKGPGNTEAFSVQCVYVASFAVEKPVEETQIRRFAENEVRLVFWPYLRHFVSDMSFRMSINPLLLPLTSELQAAQSQE